MRPAIWLCTAWIVMGVVAGCYSIKEYEGDGVVLDRGFGWGHQYYIFLDRLDVEAESACAPQASVGPVAP